MLNSRSTPMGHLCPNKTIIASIFPNGTLKTKEIIMTELSLEELDYLKSTKLIIGMTEKLSSVSKQNEQRIKYKLGLNKLKNLGIAIPHRYNGIKQANGLVEIGIRSILARIRFDGWNNDSLNKVYDANNFQAVSAQAIESSLVCGVGFISVGFGDTELGEPKVIIASENPNQVFAVYDRQRHRIIKAIKIVYKDSESTDGYLFIEGKGVREFTLTKDETVILGDWEDTNLSNNRVPMIALCNNPSFDGKIGHSEISEQWMSIVDSQARTMQAYEIAREFSVFPKTVFMGAKEEDFIGENGLSNFVDRFNLIDDPNAKVEQLSTANIQSLNEMIQTYNRAFAQVSDLPESYFGLSASANPTSAESRTIAENGLINKCTSKIDNLKGSFTILGRMVAEMLGDDFVASEDGQSFTTNFRDPSTPNQASLVAQVVSLVGAGILNPSAETTLRKLGFDRHEITAIKNEAALGKAISLLEGLNLNQPNPELEGNVSDENAAG